MKALILFIFLINISYAGYEFKITTQKDVISIGLCEQNKHNSFKYHSIEEIRDNKDYKCVSSYGKEKEYPFNTSIKCIKEDIKYTVFYNSSYFKCNHTRNIIINSL